MKRSRRCIDINLNELDQLLDHARAEPLSESDCEKLRTALHTLAELVAQRRSTEKTRAVVDARRPLRDPRQRRRRARNRRDMSEIPRRRSRERRRSGLRSWP
jgi:hypothetical protein